MNFRIFKIIAIILLLGTFFSPPYFYYQLIKWYICGFSVYQAYQYYINKGKEYFVGIHLIIAILFNPIAPIYFGKDIWQVIDVIVILYFLSSIFLEKNKQ